MDDAGLHILAGTNDLFPKHPVHVSGSPIFVQWVLGGGGKAAGGIMLTTKC